LNNKILISCGRKGWYMIVDQSLQAPEINYVDHFCFLFSYMNILSVGKDISV
jgi:hypothetical protein